MAQELIAHRFVALGVAEEAGPVAQLPARDVATGEEGLLLQLRGRRFAAAEPLLRLRARRLAGQGPFPELPEGAAGRVEGSSWFFFAGLGAGRPVLGAGPVRPGLREALAAIPRALDEAPLPVGPAHAGWLREDGGQVFLAPAAWLCPPALLDPADGAQWRGGGARHRHARAWAGLLAGEGIDVQALDEGSAGGHAAALAEAVAGHGDEGGLLVVDGPLPGGAGAVLRQVAADRGRAWRELWPHVQSTLPPARGEGAALLLLRSFREYAPFAEAWWRQREAGGLDGRELVVVERVAPARDEATRLFLHDRAQPGHSSVAGSEPGPGGEEPRGLPARVLSALRAAGRPVGAQLLQEAFDLGAGDLAAVADELERGGLVQLLVGRPDDGPASPQLVLVPGPGEGSTQLGQLLGATLAGSGSGRGPGALWLRVQASLERGDGDGARPLLERLMRRARREEMPLLEYAAHEWREREPRLGSTLEDHCRGAIRRGEQHRLRGELGRADEIFGGAQAALHGGRAQLAPALAATLAAELALERGLLAIHRSRYDEAESLLSGTLEEHKDELPALLRGRLYLDLGWAELLRGHTREAARYSELTLRILDAGRTPQLVARAYNQLGTAQYRESRYAESLQSYRRALVLREQLDDPLAVARSCNNLSLAFRSLGRFAEAERALQRSLELKRRAGDGLGVAATRLNLGFLALDQGRPDEAEAAAAEVLESARRLGHREMEAEALGLWGEARLAAGDPAGALEKLGEDLAICREAGHRTELLATLRRSVAAHLAGGAHEEAARQLEEARALLTTLASRFEAAWLDRLEGQLLEETGLPDLADELYGASAAAFGALHRIDLQVEALARRARLGLAQGRREEARRLHREIVELAGQHELHRLPPGLGPLEVELSRDDTGGPAEQLRSEQALALLGEWLASPALRGRDRQLQLLSRLHGALGSDRLLWWPAGAPGPRALEEGRLVEAAAPPAVAGRLEAARAGTGGELVAEGGWAAAPTGPGRGGWLVLHRPAPWTEVAQGLLRAAASLVEVLDTAADPAAVDLDHLPAPDPGGADPTGLVGQSDALARVRHMIHTVKDNDVSILVLGENGTGKDLVARAIHRLGQRSSGEFMAVNCASIPANLLESELFGHERGAFTSAVAQRRGLFERAHGGTIFLDEIGEMPLPMQAKLLRVLQDGSFTRVGGSETLRSDVRVLAATNRDLSQEVAAGRFRMDLYYRLNVVSIEVPPLRERPEDIEPLVEFFLDRHREELHSPVRSVGREALSRLREYRWPGNVRELENVLKSAMVFAQDDSIRVEDLPAQLLRAGERRGQASLEAAVRAMVEADDYDEERPLMPRLELLVAHEAVRALGNKAQAARVLGITKPTLYRRLRRFRALYGGEGAEGEAAGS